MTEIYQWTVAELQRALRNGALSPREAVQAIADRMDAVDTKVSGYLQCDVEAALREADSADISKPLGGVPVAIKDLINVRGQPCGCASKILAGFLSPYDATVIRKLREAGAIPFGRTNMDEFAMGSSTENSGVKLTRNPWDLERIPGGSSGGSAAVVAAREAFAALGSDTGGSIRQPASLCGCVGLKPSYGRVSRYGLTAFASSLDQIGPMTRTVEDAAMILQAIAGHDPLDSTSLSEPVPDYLSELRGGLAGVRMGLPREYFGEGVDEDVQRAVMAAVDHCQSLGAEVVEVSLPHTKYAVAVYYILATAEASSNLARFDGVRYGYRASGSKDLLEHYGKTREEGFGPEVKRRIILGTYVLSSGYHDAYYTHAQKVRTLMRRDFSEVFRQVDVLVSPTSPTVAFQIGERMANPLQMYLSDIFTIAANLSGICGISIPCGFKEIGGKRLPIGLQFLADTYREELLLRVAHAYEQSNDYHRQAPQGI